jgi:hypothetical protein
VPVVSGTAQVGQTLTGSDGSWSGTTPISFSRQWQRCAAGSDYAATVLADLPLGYWRFEEVAGSVASDSSGNGRSGSYLGGAALGAAGAVAGSKAASFDGVNDEVTVSTGAAALSPPQLTVEAWAKSKTTTWNTWGYIVSKRSSYIIHPVQGSRNIDFRVWTGATVRTLTWTPPTGFDISQWHHYAGSYDGTTARFYVDGSERVSLLASGTAAPDNGPLHIGRDDDWARYGSAFIDEVAVYATALPAARILLHAQGGGSTGTCADIAAATGSSYVPVAADVGSSLRLRVSASNSAGGPVAAESATTQAVVP